MKSIEDIFSEIDILFEQNRAEEAERLLLDSLDEAQAAGDNGMKLQLLNELIGYYRQLSEKEKLLSTITNAIETAEKMGLSGSIPYATTILNAANGYRSVGEFKKSLEYYSEVEKIYIEKLSGQDMNLAGLFNNISLLHEELGDYEKAEAYLKRALSICLANNAGFEIAVTYANLANTAVLAKKYDEAKEYANTAIKRFEERNTYDPHYCAAISALGMCLYHEGRYEEALTYFDMGMDIVERSVGKNSQYYRLKQNADICRKEIKKVKPEAKSETGSEAESVTKEETKGLDLCRRYYEIYGQPMLDAEFPEYIDKIAAGLAGEGSDCLGYDDEISRDHDWGPGFCLWVSDETYEAIGKELQEAYDSLPKEFEGYTRKNTPQGSGRFGVKRISDFYRYFVGTDDYDKIDWSAVSDYNLACAVDGEVFCDKEGVFSAMRNKLKKGYPEHIRFLKIAENAAMFSQSGQYNYFRILRRGDRLTADIMLAECMKQAMKLYHHICNVYPPHDKWLRSSFRNLPGTQEADKLLTELHRSFAMPDKEAEERVSVIMNRLSDMLAGTLYSNNYISDVDNYLDAHTDELVKKAELAALGDEEIVDKIVKLEFEAFDKVKNEGGRAYCQNDWPTFSIMRKSQYLTWNRPMLMQYYYDFQREYSIGHNLITEKYGRMMESTAPEEYAEIADNFPELSPQKKAIIEQIVALQMDMAERFAVEYPRTGGNARSLHTYEDDIVNTSYETYLRGEISTYSDKMLQLYGKYVLNCAANGINIAKQTIENTAKLYGYADIDAFENR